jgi:hypothetical protein
MKYFYNYKLKQAAGGVQIVCMVGLSQEQKTGLVSFTCCCAYILPDFWGNVFRLTPAAFSYLVSKMNYKFQIRCLIFMLEKLLATKQKVNSYIILRVQLLT